jgi:toxin ParE1/3/4
MTYEVEIALSARRDLQQLRLYLLETVSPRHARKTLIRIRDGLTTLSTCPDRGSRPKELLDLGATDYRQLIVQPYRIVYRIEDRRVLIFVVADGRRDMQSLLTKRLLSTS